MVIKNKTSASEMLEILSNCWLDTKSIQKLACVGYNKARAIKKTVRNNLIEEGYYLPSIDVVPTDKVVEYLRININYLKKVAKIQQGEK